ncbi:DUF4180 domain-containing protein [Runella zeae]|uniref:DUF4180 domain-containing protein n=1 Tax=Runella zeae TaxID=94255 RepID=UPI0003F8DDF7|nr:DUF4180 domain-containing protein [Runella zeae]
MTITAHETNGLKIAELISDKLLIQTHEDGLNLLGDLYYQGFDKIILYEHHITPDFFDLKNGLAGEILQKFSNYRMKLAIIGTFSNYTSKSIRDFIYESNQSQLVHFVGTLSEALNKAC